jgi:hypothetical protein
MSLVESSAYDLNGHEDSQRVVNAVTGRANTERLTLLNVASDPTQRAPKAQFRSPDVPGQFFVARLMRHVILTRR